MSNRFVKKWTRVYMDGYDVSGYTRNWGSAGCAFAEIGEPNLDEDVGGILPGQATISFGPLSAILNNVSDGLHDKLSGQATRTVTMAIGFDGAPAEGDPVFAGEFEQLSYKGDIGEDVPISIDFAQSVEGTTLRYAKPFGYLIHANGAETGANSADASDHDHGAQTTAGGFMVYHLLSSNGTCTLKVQDADTEANGSYSDLLSSGEIDASSAPQHGLVALAEDATVERYTRWQLSLNSATTATFVISFHRG